LKERGVGDLAQWSGLGPQLRKKKKILKESQRSTSIHFHVPPDRGDNVSSCLTLLPLCLSYHDELHPQTVKYYTNPTQKSIQNESKTLISVLKLKQLAVLNLPNAVIL